MRRRWGRQQKDDTETALANFALTFAKALLVFCVIMFVMISENKKTEDGIKPKVEAMISVSWNKDAKIDVDTWMRNSEGGIIYYMNKENGVLFLDPRRPREAPPCASIPRRKPRTFKRPASQAD